MYVLTGLMVTLTVTAMLMSAQHERTNAEYQEYNEAMEKNKAYWKTVKGRYTIFDTLKAESSPQAVGYDLLGHWQLESPSNSRSDKILLVIERDGQQTEFRYKSHSECYKRYKSFELEYYGDVNMIVKDRARESRFHYRVTEEGNLNTEELYNEGSWGLKSYARIDPRAALDIDFCDTEDR